MANKNEKKESIGYSGKQKKDLLAKWDGTAAGAKGLKVPYRALQEWRDGSLATAAAKTKSNAKAAKPGRPQRIR